MIKPSKSMVSAKEMIEKLSGQEIEVKVNLGRNKFVTFNAILSGVYPAIFTVSPINTNFSYKTSYSYFDFLCGTVEIKQKKKKAKE